MKNALFCWFWKLLKYVTLLPLISICFPPSLYLDFSFHCPQGFICILFPLIAPPPLLEGLRVNWVWLAQPIFYKNLFFMATAMAYGSSWPGIEHKPQMQPTHSCDNTGPFNTLLGQDLNPHRCSNLSHFSQILNPLCHRGKSWSSPFKYSWWYWPTLPLPLCLSLPLGNYGHLEHEHFVPSSLCAHPLPEKLSPGRVRTRPWEWSPHPGWCLLSPCTCSPALGQGLVKNLWTEFRVPWHALPCMFQCLHLPRLLLSAFPFLSAAADYPLGKTVTSSPWSRSIVLSGARASHSVRVGSWSPALLFWATPNWLTCTPASSLPKKTFHAPLLSWLFFLALMGAPWPFWSFYFRNWFLFLFLSKCPWAKMWHCKSGSTRVKETWTPLFLLAYGLYSFNIYPCWILSYHSSLLGHGNDSDFFVQYINVQLFIHLIHPFIHSLDKYSLSTIRCAARLCDRCCK